MIYLGGQHLSPPVATAVPGVLRGVNVNRTHAYLLRNTERVRRAYWRLCEMRGEPGRRQHVDYVLGGMHSRNELTTYCPVRWFCGQAAGVSMTSGRVTKAEKWWD